jgi:hypothetical protein
MPEPVGTELPDVAVEAVAAQLAKEAGWKDLAEYESPHNGDEDPDYFRRHAREALEAAVPALTAALVEQLERVEGQRDETRVDLEIIRGWNSENKLEAQRGWEKVQQLEAAREQWLREVREALDAESRKLDVQAERCLHPLLADGLRREAKTVREAIAGALATFADQSSTECKACGGHGSPKTFEDSTTIYREGKCRACNGTGHKPDCESSTDQVGDEDEVPSDDEAITIRFTRLQAEAAKVCIEHVVLHDTGITPRAMPEAANLIAAALATPTPSETPPEQSRFTKEQVREKLRARETGAMVAGKLGDGRGEPSEMDRIIATEVVDLLAIEIFAGTGPEHSAADSPLSRLLRRIGTVKEADPGWDGPAHKALYDLADELESEHPEQTPPEQSLVSLGLSDEERERLREIAFWAEKRGMVWTNIAFLHKVADPSLTLFAAELDRKLVLDHLDCHGMEAVEIGTKALLEALTEVCPNCEGDFSGGGVDEPEPHCDRCSTRGRIPRCPEQTGRAVSGSAIVTKEAVIAWLNERAEELTDTAYGLPGAQYSRRMAKADGFRDAATQFDAAFGDTR